MMDSARTATCVFRLCFRSLFDGGRGYAFPCDREGRVDLDALSDQARTNYLYARAMVGRELAVPAVETDAPQTPPGAAPAAITVSASRGCRHTRRS
jgi:hypothetical protein